METTAPEQRRSCSLRRSVGDGEGVFPRKRRGSAPPRSERELSRLASVSLSWTNFGFPAHAPLWSTTSNRPAGDDKPAHIELPSFPNFFPSARTPIRLFAFAATFPDGKKPNRLPAPTRPSSQREKACQ